ncbi:MAG: ABC transporter permease [Clostridia bacterium]|nr:ABC transporter permease [Clostridia bacterium]
MKSKSKWITVPFAVWVIIFTVVPLVLILFFAFTNEDKIFTINNITHVGKYSSVFVNSLLLSAVATAICLILGYPFAYLISKMPEKVQSIAVILVMLPMLMNFLLRTYAWMTILENNGILNSVLKFFHLPALNLINTKKAVVLGMVYNFLPYMILPIYSVLMKIDKRLIEAAKDLGAGKMKVFSKVIFPLSKPGVVSGVTMVFVPSVSTFVISKMLGGGANILIGDLIEMQFLGNSYNPHLGSAISLILILLVLICIGILNQYDSSLNSKNKSQ